MRKKPNALHALAQKKPAFMWLSLVLVTVVWPCLFFGVMQYRFHGLYSPFDESVHMDYVWKVMHGIIPAKGDTIAPEILNDWSCSGQLGTELPACGSGADASAYVAGGQNYNFIHPPIYYVLTGLLARFIGLIAPSVSFTVAARALSIFWFVLGEIALYFALRSWRVKHWYALCVCVLISVAPGILNIGTAVTNDSFSLLAGAFALWLASRFFCEKRFGILLPFIGVLFFALVKGTFVFPFIGIGLILGYQALLDVFGKRWEDARNKMLSAFSMAVACVLGVFGWSAFQSHRGDPNWTNPLHGINSNTVENPVGMLAQTILDGFDLGNTPGTLRGLENVSAYAFWIDAMMIVVCAAVWILLFQNDTPDECRALAQSAVAGMLFYPVFVQVREYLSLHSMFTRGVSIRYGIALLPIVLCCGVLAVQKSRKPYVAAGLAVLGVACGLYSVTVFIPTA